MCALCECSPLVVPRLIANVIFLIAESDIERLSSAIAANWPHSWGCRGSQ
jgi:hypothetical protein